MKMLWPAAAVVMLAMPALAQGSPPNGQSTSASAGTPTMAGAQLYGSDGLQIGTIHSVTKAEGHRMVVVAEKTLLGIDSQDVMIPLNSVRQRQAGGYVTSFTMGQVDLLPKLNPGDVP